MTNVVQTSKWSHEIHLVEKPVKYEQINRFGLILEVEGFGLVLLHENLTFSIPVEI